MLSDSEIISDKFFDVAIIGGGINGAGIALDAALRGLSVILVDKDDFGSHTTSASTKLIHGGLRYLEYFEFNLVRESLRERERLLKNVPHLAWPLKINVPIYKNSTRGPLIIKTGMIFYDLLSFDKSMPRHNFRFNTKNGKLKKIEPSLQNDKLTAIASYYDCQIGFPERLCLELILSACEAGALVFNHHELIEYRDIESDLKQLIVKDKYAANKEINIKAKLVVNAGGIYVDKICNLVDDGISRKMGGTKGSHIIINQFDGGPQDALYVEAQQDGRPFFIIPWREFYLVGTTDIYYEGNLDTIVATEDELNYLLNELNYLIPNQKFTMNDVIYTYSGIRPLSYEPDKKESQVTRKHIIFDHEKHDGHTNFISIIGGKLTTYRSLAEECIDLICKKMGIKEKCRTREYPLVGGCGISSIKNYIRILSIEYSKRYGLSEKTVEYLINFYGSLFKKVLELIDTNPSLKEKICEDNLDIKAQIVYGIKYEFAKNLDDILLRRTSIGTSRCMGLDCVEIVAETAAVYFNWEKEEREKNILAYRQKIKKFYRFMN